MSSGSETERGSYLYPEDGELKAKPIAMISEDVTKTSSTKLEQVYLEEIEKYNSEE